MRSSHPALALALAVPAALALALATALVPARARAAPGPAAPSFAPPALARQLRASGVVTVEALVDEDGVVRAANVLDSQPVLDDAAVERVFAMSFPPPASDTTAVATVRTLHIAFDPPRPEPEADPWIESRCAETTFRLDVGPRPDSTGRYVARWQASGLRSQELFVVVLTPDGVEVDTTGSWFPERFTEEPGSPGWPAWHAEGDALRKGGTGGAFAFTVPERSWWDTGRVAVVALFRNSFDGQMVARQKVWRLERDEEGPLLVPDPRAAPCLAGPWVRGR